MANRGSLVTVRVRPSPSRGTASSSASSASWTAGSCPLARLEPGLEPARSPPSSLRPRPPLPHPDRRPHLEPLAAESTAVVAVAAVRPSRLGCSSKAEATWHHRRTRSRSGTGRRATSAPRRGGVDSPRGVRSDLTASRPVPTTRREVGGQFLGAECVSTLGVLSLSRGLRTTHAVGTDDDRGSGSVLSPPRIEAGEAGRDELARGPRTHRGRLFRRGLGRRRRGSPVRLLLLLLLLLLLRRRRRASVELYESRDGTR